MISANPAPLNQTIAAAYARYSTDNQDSNSIAYQLDKIQSYCKDHHISIAAYYVDEAMSGTNTSRDGFQRLMRAAHRKEFNAVVIYDISRGSRDVGDWFAFRKEMLVLGIQIISATQTLGDLTDPSSFLHELISVGLGQHQVLDTRKKSIDGVAVKAREGKFLGGSPPLGYTIVDGEYVINPEEATCIKRIFSMYAKGHSYDEIIDTLQGVKGRKGKPLGKNSLHFILKNERYVGTYTWNKRFMKLMRRWAGGKPNPKCERIENRIPAIIDLDTWVEVQKRMSNNKRNAANKAKREYLLSGLIQCGKCGATYIGSTTKNKKGYEYSKYICGNKSRTHTCDAKNLPLLRIESEIIAYIDEYFASMDYETIADEIMSEYNNLSPDLAAEKAELAQITAQIHNGMKYLLKGHEFPELSDEVDRLRLRKSELEDIVQAKEKEASAPISREGILKTLKAQQTAWKEGRKKEVVQSVIEKIYANEDGTVTIPIGVVAHKTGCGGGI